MTNAVYQVGGGLLDSAEFKFQALFGLELLVKDLDKFLFRQVLEGLGPLIMGHLIII